MQEELERGSVAPPDAAWRSAVAQRGGEDQANGPHSRPSGTSMRAKRTGRSRTDATAPTRFTRGYVPPPRLGEERPRPRHRFRRALRVRLIRCAPRRSLRPFGAGRLKHDPLPTGCAPPALTAGCTPPAATFHRPFGAQNAIVHKLGKTDRSAPAPRSSAAPRSTPPFAIRHSSIAPQARHLLRSGI